MRKSHVIDNVVIITPVWSQNRRRFPAFPRQTAVRLSIVLSSFDGPQPIDQMENTSADHPCNHRAFFERPHANLQSTNVSTSIWWNSCIFQLILPPHFYQSPTAAQTRTQLLALCERIQRLNNAEKISLIFQWSGTMRVLKTILRVNFLVPKRLGTSISSSASAKIWTLTDRITHISSLCRDSLGELLFAPTAPRCSAYFPQSSIFNNLAGNMYGISYDFVIFGGWFRSNYNMSWFTTVNFLPGNCPGIFAPNRVQAPQVTGWPEPTSDWGQSTSGPISSTTSSPSIRPLQQYPPNLRISGQCCPSDFWSAIPAPHLHSSVGHKSNPVRMLVRKSTGIALAFGPMLVSNHRASWMSTIISRHQKYSHHISFAPSAHAPSRAAAACKAFITIFIGKS